MKIAMIGHKRVPSRSGGVEVVVCKLSELLVKMGFSVDIYNRRFGKDKVREYEGARVFEIPTFKNPKLNAMVYSFFAVLRAVFTNVDVIHFHAEGSCVMMPIARLFRKRCVVTIHGLDWQRSKWGGFASRYIRFGEKMAAQFAHEIIVLSKEAQDYFLKIYNRQTRFIPNGIEKKQRVPAEIITEKYGLVKNSYLLFLARITPEKGLDYLLDAFSKIDTDKKLVIAGAIEPSTEYIERVMAKAKQEDRIVWTGFVSGRIFEELFSNCFLYVLPSDLEGMPLSLLEAIGYRARCLVSDIPENISVAEEYLHTFEKGSVASLRKQLTFILENEEIRDLNFGLSGSAEETDKIIDALIARYDWGNIAVQTAALYVPVSIDKC